jgi:predicted nuclease with TOPRIM domain
MKNSVLEVDPKRYGRLLARKLPAVIRTEEENERLIAELEQLDKRYDELTPEEREYSELLTVLIEAFEGRQLRPRRINARQPVARPDGRARPAPARLARRVWFPRHSL